MDTSIDTLRRLVDVDKKFYSKFKDIVDEKQGMETHLAKMYLPITSAQAATTLAQAATTKAIEKTGETTATKNTRTKNCS